MTRERPRVLLSWDVVGDWEFLIRVFLLLRERAGVPGGLDVVDLPAAVEDDWRPIDVLDRTVVPVLLRIDVICGGLRVTLIVCVMSMRVALDCSDVGELLPHKAVLDSLNLGFFSQRWLIRDWLLLLFKLYLPDWCCALLAPVCIVPIRPSCCTSCHQCEGSKHRLTF